MIDDPENNLTPAEEIVAAVEHGELDHEQGLLRLLAEIANALMFISAGIDSLVKPVDDKVH